MAYKMKGFSGFGNSPAKHTRKDDKTHTHETKESKEGGTIDVATYEGGKQRQVPNSPNKQKQQKHAVKGDTWSGYGTTNPSASENKKREHKTKPSWVIKAEEKRIMKRLAKTFPSIHPITESKKIDRKYNKKSPFKQEGPIDEKQTKLQPSENPDTWVYKPGKGMKDKKFIRSERIGGLEDRISFIDETANAEGRSINKQEKKDKAKLQQELAILRKSKH
jgi:hypothetical protein